jgi:hypothetical protein
LNGAGTGLFVYFVASSPYLQSLYEGEGDEGEKLVARKTQKRKRRMGMRGREQFLVD